jgi:hypothetical protein
MLPPTATPQATERIHPSIWYAAIAAPFLLAGILFSGFFFYKGIKTIADTMARTTIPETLQAELHRNLKYTIFLELLSDPAHHLSLQNQATVECQVSAMNWGAPVVITRPRVNFTYSLSGMSGRSIYEFVAPTEGIYLINCSDLQGWNGTARAAVGTGTTEIFGSVILRCLLFGGVGVIVAMLILFRVIMLRDQSKRDIRSRGLKPI